MLRTLDELLEMDQLKVATAVGSRSWPTDHPRARRERAEKALQHPDCSAILRRKLQAMALSLTAASKVAPCLHLARPAPRLALSTDRAEGTDIRAKIRTGCVDMCSIWPSRVA